MISTTRKLLLALSVTFFLLIFALLKYASIHNQDANVIFSKVITTEKQLNDPLISLLSQKNHIPDNVLPVLYPEPFEYYTPSDGQTEKYITYLPHSGFHNQRIELENALLLAVYLNRTLLLPSVYLGNPAFPWLRFDKMYERLLLQTKNGLDYCSLVRDGEPIPSECLNYERWTTVPWTFFYDFSQIKERVRIVFREDLSFEWIKKELKVQEDKDIYLFKDTSPFEFRIYDLPESKTPLTRFVNRLDISTLEAIEERVIHFGSVFGTYRVLAQSQEHAGLLKFIRSNMIFKNPTLLDSASKIVNKLGGIGTFVGVHLRVGDGLFKMRASINIDDIYHQLVNGYTDLTDEEVGIKYELGRHDQDRLEDTNYEVRQLREFPPLTEDQKQPIRTTHPEDIELRLGKSDNRLSLKCQSGDGRNDRFAKTTIFIATDCPNPRYHPLLRKIFDTFPCTFVLSDFKEELTNLAKIQVVEEKVKLESYLIPMVDAIISSQGSAFYGTNSSTFSTYIERQLHPAYTNQPIELVGAPLP